MIDNQKSSKKPILINGIKIWILLEPLTYVTGPAKTGHICTNYTCSENGTFLGLCL